MFFSRFLHDTRRRERSMRQSWSKRRRKHDQTAGIWPMGIWQVENGGYIQFNETGLWFHSFLLSLWHQQDMYIRYIIYIYYIYILYIYIIYMLFLFSAIVCSSWSIWSIAIQRHGDSTFSENNRRLQRSFLQIDQHLWFLGSSTLTGAWFCHFQ